MMAIASWEASPVGANRRSSTQAVVHPAPTKLMITKTKAVHLGHTHRRGLLSCLNWFNSLISPRGFSEFSTPSLKTRS